MPAALNLSNETIQEIIHMYVEEKMVLTEIVKKTGISIFTLSKLLQKNHVKTRDQSDYRKYSLDEAFFEKLDTNNKCYILGFLYADGNISNDGLKVKLVLQERDKEILEKIKKEMNSGRPLAFMEESKRNHLGKQDQWKLEISCKKMVKDLEQWGVIPNKTLKLKYPDFLSDDQHSHFLRGVMDGDGCIGCYQYPDRERTLVNICGTYDFCQGAKDIIESKLGIHCSLVPRGKICVLSISGRRQTTIFLNWGRLYPHKIIN